MKNIGYFNMVLFLRLIKERETNNERYSLEISVFEVYNNEINDLLTTGDVSTLLAIFFYNYC